MSAYLTRMRVRQAVQPMQIHVNGAEKPAPSVAVNPDVEVLLTYKPPEVESCTWHMGATE